MGIYDFSRRRGAQVEPRRPCCLVCVHERSPTATRGNSHCSYGVVLNRLEYVACQYKRSDLMLRLLHRRGDESEWT